MGQNCAPSKQKVPSTSTSSDRVYVSVYCLSWFLVDTSRHNIKTAKNGALIIFIDLLNDRFTKKKYLLSVECMYTLKHLQMLDEALVYIENTFLKSALHRVVDIKDKQHIHLCVWHVGRVRLGPRSGPALCWSEWLITTRGWTCFGLSELIELNITSYKLKRNYLKTDSNLSVKLCVLLWPHFGPNFKNCLFNRWRMEVMIRLTSNRTNMHYFVARLHA